jgi:GNAT superfamily N-acetyltransferase
MNYLTKILDSGFDRKSFRCGKTSLDHYLHEQVGQDIRRKIAVCFILAGNDNSIKAYYTLSNGSIPLEGLPEDYRKIYPKSYDHLPVTLLGRFAVDQKYQGQGMGKLLLIDALKRSYEASLKSVGSMAVIVDVLDSDAEKFYRKFGFINLPDSARMFLTMKTIGLLFD